MSILENDQLQTVTLVLHFCVSIFDRQDHLDPFASIRVIMENELLKRVSWLVNTKLHFWQTRAAATSCSAAWGGGRTSCTEENSREEKAKEIHRRCQHEQEDAGTVCVGRAWRGEELRHDESVCAHPGKCEEDVEEGCLQREPDFHLIFTFFTSTFMIRRTKFFIWFKGETGDCG